MLDTLRTLFRASRAETEEALIDGNAITLLAQHLRDAKADVERARRGLAALIARKAGEERQARALEDEIVRREGDARAAMNADEEALLHEIADRIAGLEDRKAQAAYARNELQQRIDALRETLREAERRMTTLTDELRLARSQALQRRTRGEIDPGVQGSALQKAEEVAERLRVSGARIDDATTALADMRPDADLDSRLRDAGLDSRDAARRSAILDRIKQIDPSDNRPTNTGETS